MCGRCRQIFNAFQSLSRVEEPDETQAANLEEVVAEAVTSDEMPTPVPGISPATEPVADPLFLREEPLPLPVVFSASLPAPRAPLPPAAPPNLLHRSYVGTAPSEENDADKAPAAHFRTTASTRIEPAIDLSDEDNPLLAAAPASRYVPPVASPRAWSVGVFVLFVGLLAQVTYAFRTTLISSYPQLRPTVSQLCDFVGCSLSWGRDETAFEIVGSELIETPGKPGRILLTATLINRSKNKQDLPSLELRLTDNANQVVVSRPLHPGDYLGRTIAKGEGLAPGTELYINLNLEVSNKSLASGYGLLPFFP